MALGGPVQSGLSALQILESRFLDWFFPKRCVACRKEGGWLCPPCARGCVPSCLSIRKVHGHSVTVGLAFEAPPVRELLHILKYEGISEAALVLIGLLSQIPDGKVQLERLIGQSGKGTVLVPVPSSVATRRQRGYSQAELLAVQLGRWLGLPVWHTALRRQQAGSQVGRTAVDRQRLMREAFCWAGRPVPEAYVDRTWVVVDDLLTTGATLSACLNCLKDKGATTLQALAIAQKS